MSVHDDWVKYPTGKIGKGEWCDCCARFNGRRMTVNVIGVKEGKILLIKRGHDPEKGRWALVGGYLDWDETVEECAKREFREETGLELQRVRLVGLFDGLDRDKDGRQNISLCYVGEVVGESFTPDHEVEAVKWFDLNDIPSDMAFDNSKMIEVYLKSVS